LSSRRRFVIVLVSTLTCVRMRSGGLYSLRGNKFVPTRPLRFTRGHPVRYDSFDEGETTPHETKDAKDE
jgi:hypothetical protein